MVNGYQKIFIYILWIHHTQTTTPLANNKTIWKPEIICMNEHYTPQANEQNSHREEGS
jgi:hypothetical protein